MTQLLGFIAIRMSRQLLPESIALVANSDYRLFRFRRALIKELIERGSQVQAIAPSGAHVDDLEKLGVQFWPWRLRRASLNPVDEIRSLWEIIGLMRSSRPTVCHSFTIKPNMYVPVAAHLAGVQVIVATYTGLGHIFSDCGVYVDSKAALLRKTASYLIYVAARFSDAIIFQNPDDLAQLVDLGLVPSHKARLITGGSGVDTVEFSPSSGVDTSVTDLKRDLQIGHGTVTVLLAGRMLWLKGIEEYVASARLLRSTGLNTRFLLAGETDSDDPGAIPSHTLDEWAQAGDIDYLGHRNDIDSLLRLADIVVLPSTYGEGIPRILIEAASTGKPIITTDSPGCREVVDQGVNGLIVPPGDVEALSDAIRRLALDEALRRQFGTASRRKALREFDERKVSDQTLGLYAELLARKAGGGR